METERCEQCGAAITWKVYRYSMNYMKKGLCMKHQMEWRDKNMQPKMAKFINQMLTEKYYRQ